MNVFNALKHLLRLFAALIYLFLACVCALASALLDASSGDGLSFFLLGMSKRFLSESNTGNGLSPSARLQDSTRTCSSRDIGCEV